MQEQKREDAEGIHHNIVIKHNNKKNIQPWSTSENDQANKKTKPDRSKQAFNTQRLPEGSEQNVAIA
ncbi:hypothetical protein LNP74_16015 [Klebsiella pneumoniae subsp. pneumoniae]|nr:hypothetical protein [Klebsiella pneumoniae subsp. pneumoniae]